MPFFDIDTVEVLKRCLIALNPFTSVQFFPDNSIPSGDDLEAPFEIPPDLYGPFWICTTVIFALFFSSSLTGVFYSAYKGIKYEYQFDLLSGAASILYSYTFLWPPALWFISGYVLDQTSSDHLGSQTSISKLLCLFGYANIIWIPVAVLAVSPLAGAFPGIADLVRWIVVGFGYLFSVSFLGKNLKPLFVPEASTEKKQGIILLGLVCLLHIALAVSIKYLFFGSLKQVSN